jgi:hypothetical protein
MLCGEQERRRHLHTNIGMRRRQRERGGGGRRHLHTKAKRHDRSLKLITHDGQAAAGQHSLTTHSLTHSLPQLARQLFICLAGSCTVATALHTIKLSPCTAALSAAMAAASEEHEHEHEEHTRRRDEELAVSWPHM